MIKYLNTKILLVQSPSFVRRIMFELAYLTIKDLTEQIGKHNLDVTNYLQSIEKIQKLGK